eukprot:COSAG02_NODE_30093_length_557_cov_1.013100_1_plen_33_part_10
MVAITYRTGGQIANEFNDEVRANKDARHHLSSV